MTEPQRWLLDQWAGETARTLQSMTETRPGTACEPLGPGETVPKDDVSIIEVVFSLGEGASMWLALPAEAVEALGLRTLRAAGIDDAGPEEVRGTCTEIVQQAHAGLAQAISRRVQQGITAQGHEAAVFPAGLPVFKLEIEYSDSPAIVTYLTVAPELLAGLEVPEEKVAPPKPAAQAEPQEISATAGAMSKSKTFDVLLDVSMPVSVSFGRTEMMIKDVLKLTTGSIVELNRNVAEPVDVIVNDRIIARGEVVVVEGNYGVRIHQIVSLQERFRTSTQAVVSTAKAELANV